MAAFEKQPFMSKKLWRLTFFIVIIIYLPIHASAWGTLGHRIVGEIADSYLTVKARKQIEQILGTESIAIASNWADFIKSDTSYKYLNSWHYVDFEKDLEFNSAQKFLLNDQTDNIYNKTVFVIKQLNNRSLSKEKKVFYLRLLIHFIGDIHQPLHASAHGTSGGNSIKLNWFGESTNLHRVWDEHLIEFQQLSYTEYVKAINHTTLAKRLEWQKQPISKWVYESYEQSQKIHADIKPDQRLSFNYNFKYIDLLNRRLLQGGVRLAGVLNEIFG